MKKSVFKPRKGQTDFTNLRFAPVINCVLRHQNKFLVVKRSKKLNFYPGYWSGISGFLDDNKTLKEKVIAEIKEELGIPKDKITKIKLAGIFHQEEPTYKKVWIVHPVLVDVKTTTVKLDWEAKEFTWLTIPEIKKLKLLPGFSKVLKKLSPWIRK